MQKNVEMFISSHHLSCGIQNRYIDLTSEVGELGKELLKGCDYGKQPCQITAETVEELGDCLFSLLALCSEMHIDADAALRTALEKYEARFSQKGKISSDNEFI